MTTRILIAALVILCVTADRAEAQRLDLSISPAVIAFTSADPDSMPVVSSAPLTISYRIQQNPRQAWQLTVQAVGDLMSGPSSVDTSAVSWVATPAPPFQNGTLSRIAAQTVASGTGNVASPSTGSITFRLANSWSYDVGTYTQTIVFTLSTP